MYDVIIIGGGPAGISAGLYTQRANKKTLIIYQESTSLQKAAKIENYYGFEDGISGSNLYKTGIKQAQNIGIKTLKEEVIRVGIIEEGFEVVTDKNIYFAKAIIIAIGTKKNKTNIKGVKELEGKGVSYCAICDGFFYRNKIVAVLGSGNYAISELNDLINIANKIILLTNGEIAPEIRADNVEINTKKVKELVGEKRLEKVIFSDNTNLAVDGIFIAQGVASSSDFAKKLGIFLNKDNIIVNEKMETNIKGIYACGDCIGGTLQISKAVYDGMQAGLQVIQYLRSM